MKRAKRGRRSRRGETLVEILVAILIIALSAGLFATMYSASMNIDLSARRQDELFHEAVGTLEDMIGNGEGKGEDAKLQYRPEGGGTPSDEQVQLFVRDGMFVYRDDPEGGTP